MKIYSLTIILLGLLLISCEDSRQDFRMATGAVESRHYRVGNRIAKVLNQYMNHEFALDTIGQGSINNSQRLIQGFTNFALAQNDVPVSGNQGELRTVLPLYPQLFFIIYRDSIEAHSLKELVQGRKIAIGPETGATSTFTKTFFESMGIEASDYELIYSNYQANTISDSIPISISVTGFNNSRIREMLIEKKGKIWSLDKAQLMNRGSLVDGFCLQYPFAYPFIIPKNTYQKYPSQPVLTIALDNVLLAHKSVDVNTVYTMVKTILDNKEILVGQDVSFRFIKDNFNNESLQFPLHEGTKQYLNRNKPSFLERYAELLALIVTTLTVGIGGLSTFWRWNKQRKKDRIDEYYLEVLKIENEAKQVEDISRLKRMLEEMERLRQKAFSQLVQEKLLADDSFRIFITLLHDISALVEKRIDSLKNLSQTL